MTEDLRTPPSGCRPGIRWWWSAPLDGAEAVRELGEIARAGFGEVEIAYSPDGWATPEQRRTLRAVLDEAAGLGITVSMTMGASWPVRTPNTGEGSGFAAEELQYGRLDLNGDTHWSGPPPAPFDAEELDQPRRLVAVTAARVLEDGDRPELLPEGDRPRWGSPVRPAVRSTVLDPESLVQVAGATAEHVEWAPPAAGHWILVALWARENLEHNTNPFDADAARAAAAHLDEHQLGAEATTAVDASPGDFFEDSLELNAVSVFWTPRLLEEFRVRRGYELTPFLPLLFAHGMSNYWVPATEPVPDLDLPGRAGAQVRSDYHRTLTDLYVDRHLAVYQDWAETHGRTFKAQVAYGQNLEPVRSARELAARGGRVETESLNSGDRAPVRMSHPTWRFALDHQRCLVSGVHQAGRTRVSTELGAQFLKTYELGLGDYQELMDKEWAAGVSRPYVHGFAYMPPGTEWPGQQRFGDFTSESWNDRYFPQWPAWRALNDYWARGTWVLESGTARADVAVYRDGFLTSTARGFATPDAEGLSPRHLFDARCLEREGHVVQFVDPVLLEETATGPELLPDTVAYRAVVVDERTLPPRVVERLREAAGEGLRIVLVGDVAQPCEELADLPGVARVATQADVATALRRLGVAPRVSTGGVHLLVQLRECEEVRRVLLYNPADHPVRARISVEGGGVPYVLDLWSGERRRCGQFRIDEDRTTVPVAVGPRTCLVLEMQTGPVPLHVIDDEPHDIVVDDERLVLRAVEPGTRELRLSDGSRVGVVARPPERALAAVGPYTWRLTVETSAPPDAARTVIVEDLPALADWRAIGELATVAGVATYEGTFTIPDDWIGPDRGVLLDLGHVAGTAETSVNGTPVGIQVADGAVTDVSAALRAGANTLTVVVRTVLRNAVSHHRATSSRTSEVGLRGPVTFTPYADHVVSDPRGTSDE
ncbi:glycosyl hydrolase [Nocardioides sp. NPDC126508]